MILTLVGLYLAVVAYYFFMQRNFIYHPDRRSVDDAALASLLQMEVVTAQTADGLRLAGWYAPPRVAGRPVILLFHGNAGSIAWRGGKAQLFLGAGYGVLLAEYRGYGGNPGKPAEAGLYADARAWMAVLDARGVAADDIVLYGESLGAGPAVRMAAEYPAVKALVLETPFTSLTDTARRHMPFLPVRLLMKDRFDNMGTVGALRMPLLVLHGERDTIVPYAQGVRLFETAREPKFMETYAEGGHNDLYMMGAGERVLRFLEWLERGPFLMQNSPAED